MLEECVVQETLLLCRGATLQYLLPVKHEVSHFGVLVSWLYLYSLAMEILLFQKDEKKRKKKKPWNWDMDMDLSRDENWHFTKKHRVTNNKVQCNISK